MTKKKKKLTDKDFMCKICKKHRPCMIKGTKICLNCGDING